MFPQLTRKLAVVKNTDLRHKKLNPGQTALTFCFPWAIIIVIIIIIFKLADDLPGPLPIKQVRI